ncbi:MAG: sulfite exporter TauE/SafE family protein [Mycobacterium sp.]
MFTLFSSVVGVGCLIGLTTVLFGFGGGFITVPVVSAIVAAQGGSDAMHTAVATSTAVMVVTALSATAAQRRSGRLHRRYLWPMIVFIGLGAAVGALAADRLSETVLTVAFVGYLAVTIADGIGRSGFLGAKRRRAATARALSMVTATAGGMGIGAVAGLLGVGGSVMTVPLLRRRGLPMADAVAMANPLSIPVAVVATAVYAVTGPTMPHAGQIGQIDVSAAAALLCGSLPTIAVVKRFAGRIADRIHAIAYLVLLAVVMVAMTLALVS